MERTDAPASYVRWTALYTLAAAVERKVELSFGAWKLVPNLYVMLVGPPGMRKTSTMEDFSSLLLDQIPSAIRGPDLFTKEYLVKQIMNSPSAAVFLMIGEFGDIFQKNGPELYDALISHYDAKKRLTEGTIMRGANSVDKPCLNMLAGTTPTWITGNMNASVIGGGLGSRCIFVFENKLRAPKLFTDDDVVTEDLVELENNLIHDLLHISQLEGQFRIPNGYDNNQKHEQLIPYGDRKDKQWMKDWYANLMNSPRSDNNQIALYQSRKHIQVFKIAMLHSIAERDDLVLLREDLEFGIKAVESTEKNLLRVFGGMGRNEYVEDTTKIAEFVVEYCANHGPVPEAILFDKYKQVATPRMLFELIEGLIKTEQLTKLERNVQSTNEDGRKILELKTFYGPGERLLKELI